MTGQDGAALASYHHRRQEDARTALLSALGKIEAEIAEHGFYPDPEDRDKPCRLSQAEVLRRAGLSESYLRNARNKSLRKIVQDRLRALSKRSATTKAEAGKLRQDTLRYYEQALKQVSAQALRWKTDKAELEEKIRNLEAQIAGLQGAGNVVGFHSRDGEPS
ncbi:hypothetical protein [Mangrovicoccus ximenensis]|uniref:hypothetical protein n=1 Tax=Mangrovicoccus ximenensis TaxID=1911570 RepID=UPI000D375A63|nr:hypothetical protein [Mangrovicoccus ximenensis]